MILQLRCEVVYHLSPYEGDAEMGLRSLREHDGMPQLRVASLSLSADVTYTTELRMGRELWQD